MALPRAGVKCPWDFPRACIAQFDGWENLWTHGLRAASGAGSALQEGRSRRAHVPRGCIPGACWPGACWPGGGLADMHLSKNPYRKMPF